MRAELFGYVWQRPHHHPSRFRSLRCGRTAARGSIPASSRLQFDSPLSKEHTQDFLFTCGARHPGMLHTPSFQKVNRAGTSSTGLANVPPSRRKYQFNREHKICVRSARAQHLRGGITESSKIAPTPGLEHGDGGELNFIWFGSLTAAPPRLRRLLPQMGFYLARLFDSTCGLIAECREVIHPTCKQNILRVFFRKRAIKLQTAVVMLVATPEFTITQTFRLLICSEDEGGAFPNLTICCARPCKSVAWFWKNLLRAPSQELEIPAHSHAYKCTSQR